MVVFGPVSSIFDIGTFAVMWYVFGATTEAQSPLFQAGWFVEGLATQTLIVHMIRTQKLPFVQSRPALPLLLTTIAVVAVGMAIAVGPVAHVFKFAPLPLAYFPWWLALVGGYVVLTQVVKSWYLRRYGWQ
jgi:Mg2+-importing ATPase